MACSHKAAWSAKRMGKVIAWWWSKRQGGLGGGEGIGGDTVGCGEIGTDPVKGLPEEGCPG